MRPEWQKKYLAETCQIKPPKQEAREKVAPAALVSFVPMEDLAIDCKLLNPKQVKPLASVIKSYTYFADGDVLLAKITPCFENGKLGIATGLHNGIGFGSSEFIVFRPSPSLDKEYLYYYLSRDDFREEGAAQMGGAVGQQRVPKEFIESRPIWVPPLPEQRRIVAFLDEAFDGIATAKASAKKNLQNAHALFKSHLQSVFAQRGEGWVEKPLGQLASFRNGINYTKNSKGERVSIVGVKDFQRSFWLPVKNLDIVTIDGKLSEIDELRAGDILSVRSNGNIELIGRCILAGEIPSKITYSGFTIRIRLLGGDVLPAFLCYFMKSAGTRKRLIEGGTGTNIKSLNQGVLSALSVAFPSAKEQKRVVKALDELSAETDRLATLYERKFAALDELKRSLLYQAFSAQL
jgi:type I restriction enzyme, S subunit